MELAVGSMMPGAPDTEKGSALRQALLRLFNRADMRSVLSQDGEAISRLEPVPDRFPLHAHHSRGAAYLEQRGLQRPSECTAKRRQRESKGKRPSVRAQRLPALCSLKPELFP